MTNERSHVWQEMTDCCINPQCRANRNSSSADQPCPCPWSWPEPEPRSSNEIVESLLRFAQHAPLCLVSQWQPTDEEDFDCPDCTCGLVLLEQHGRQLAERLKHEPRVGDDQITRYIRALNEPAKAFQYCHPDTIRELVALLEELEQRRLSQPPADDYRDSLYAGLIRRGYAQHEAHALAYGLGLAPVAVLPANSDPTKAPECGACDKPGEHCSNVHGICSRHGGKAHSGEGSGR